MKHETQCSARSITQKDIDILEELIPSASHYKV